MRSIDIIIPVYNNRDFVIESILSALAQNDVVVNIIVINDGSTDDTDQYIRNSEVFSQITYISKENGGVASARNLGLMHCKSDFICFLDSDDIMYPNFCSTLINTLEKTHAKIGFSDFNFIDENGEKILNINKQEVYSGNVSAEIFKNNFLMTPTVLFSRSLLADRKFDETLRYNEDWKFWIPLLLNNNLSYIQTPLIGIRSLSCGLSAMKELHGDAYLTVLKYIHNKYDIFSIFKSEYSKIFYTHSYNLLSYGKFVDSFNYFKKVKLSKINFVQILKYYIKFFVVYTGIITFYRKLKKCFYRERLDLI